MIRCPICHSNAFHAYPQGTMHWCLRAEHWVKWRAGVFTVMK